MDVKTVQGWLQYKNIIPIEKISYADEEVINIEYHRIYDMFEDIRKLVEYGIRFWVCPGSQDEDVSIEIILTDTDWEQVTKQ
jgi:hypothetical protein